MVKIHQRVTFQAIPSMRSSANAQKLLQTDGRTDQQNSVLWLLLSINLGAFFLCGYWVLCGCVCMSRPTKRCLVATFVHKFGCLFSCVAIGFVWLQINKIATKVPTVQKQGKSEGFDSCDRPSNLKLDSNRQFFPPVLPWKLMDDLAKQ